MMDRDRADLRVVVHVLGTSMPPTARRLQVELQPGPSAAHDSGELCPVVHATGTVNGLPLRLRWDGGWKTYECGVLLYDRELPADLPSELLGEATSSGLGFDVMPSVMPSMGVVSFEGEAVSPLLAAS